MIEPHCRTFVADGHVRAAVELIDHTWDPVVLSALRLGSTRCSDLLRRIAGVSDKVLTESIRHLASCGLIAKTATGARRDSAVYALTELGASFADGPLAQLAAWAAEHQGELSSSA